ncbi:SDR family NAD(P)-dependent oxidoreductase [Streptomyces sp. NPDC088115]|uniref:SDR family NAD(P)-dependent oxidoreductase n=1 Tax=Streptomyces sp. NPDC088115 TaxID=3365824 RepID=UPI0038227EA2
MSDIGGTPRTAPADLTGIGLLAGAVPGVREAVAVTRHRVRTPGASGGRDPEGAPATAAAAGTPLPDDRPAVSTGPAPRVPADGVGTLTEALLKAAELAPERGTTFVLRDGATDRQTYAELLDEALRLLAGLRGAGVGRGEAVLLQCADSRAFLTGFWACVLGGFLPTPVGPAPDYTADNAVTRKLRSAWQLLGRPFVLTDTELRDGVAGLGRGWGAGFRTGSVAELTAAEAAEPEAAHPDQPALNLLTSGSTGTPKCVRHAHRSVVARSYATAQANGFTEHEVTLNFMPLDHVGGIVMSNVRDVLLRCEHVNALTDSLVRRPVNLLDWCEHFEITNTWAPNFAFALVNKHAAEIEAGSWDLSRLRHICNAGEAVVPRTAHRLLELLTPHGLPPSAMVPCWGMSETSSGVTYSAMDARDPAVGTVSLDPASLDGPLVALPHGTPRAVVLADAGPPIPGVGLRIVGRGGEVLPEGRVGRLQVTGDTLLLEYFRNAPANAASFTDDGWFETGDLAFLRQGRLTLTGREKDMVIVNGANHPVSDIEAVVEQCPGVRPACAAVCAVRDEEADTGALLVFFVPAEDAAGDLDGTVTAIRAELARDLALRPKAVVPVTADEFPRTASGKIQRNQLAEAYADGRFDGRQYDRRPARDETEDDWLLERVWTAVDEAGADSPTRPVLLYAPGDSTLAEHLTGLLPGGRIRVLSAGIRPRTPGPGHAEVDPLDPEQHDRALAHLTGDLGEPLRVLYAWASGPGPAVAGAAPDGLAAAHLLVALAALARAHPDAEVTVLTRHALGVAAEDEVDPGRAALSGLVRSAAAEGLLGSVGLLDVPADAGAAECARLALTRYGTDTVAVRDGTAYAPRLRMTARPTELGVPAEALRPGGTCLVIGGLGGLGRIVAEYLVAALGARLLITGRTPEAELPRTGAGAVLRDLRDLGDVRYAAVDVASAAALGEAVTEAEKHWGRPLDLVVHTAGASPAPQWEDLSAHQFGRESVPWLRTMLHSKLEGGAAVGELLDGHPDTGVVLFSSVNGFLGGSAYSAYAAANAALDGFAHRWAAGGRYVRCLAWSMWAGVGMNDGSPLIAAAQRRGLRLIEPSDGLGLLLAALNQPRPYLLIGADPGNPHLEEHLAPDQFAGGSTVVAVVPDGSVEPEAVRSAVAAALARRGVLAQVLAVPQIARDPGGSPDAVRILAQRDGAAGPSRYVAPQGATESVVARVIQEQLKQGPVGREDSVFALGGDSIQVLQVAGVLGECFGRELPVRLLYVHPTVRELATAIDAGGPG